MALGCEHDLFLVPAKDGKIGCISGSRLLSVAAHRSATESADPWCVFLAGSRFPWIVRLSTAVLGLWRCTGDVCWVKLWNTLTGSGLACIFFANVAVLVDDLTGLILVSEKGDSESRINESINLAIWWNPSLFVLGHIWGRNDDCWQYDGRGQYEKLLMKYPASDFASFSCTIFYSIQVEKSSREPRINSILNLWKRILVSNRSTNTAFDSSTNSPTRPIKKKSPNISYTTLANFPNTRRTHSIKNYFVARKSSMTEKITPISASLSWQVASSR